jgi:hypothetical protein
MLPRDRRPMATGMCSDSGGLRPPSMETTVLRCRCTAISNLSRAHRGGAAERLYVARVSKIWRQFMHNPLHSRISHRMSALFLLIFSCVNFSDWWLMDKESEFWILTLYKSSYLSWQRLDLHAYQLCRIWMWVYMTGVYPCIAGCSNKSLFWCVNTFLFSYNFELCTLYIHLYFVFSDLLFIQCYTESITTIFCRIGEGAP